MITKNDSVRNLTLKDCEKLSALCGTPVVELMKLRDIGVLDKCAVIRHIVAYDYQRITKDGKFTLKQVKAAIAAEYKLSTGSIENIIYHKEYRKSACQQCGNSVSPQELKRNGGICDACVVSNIKL